MNVSPSFERVRTALLRLGEPDRVPIVEADVDRDVKNAFLGRPVRSLEDEVEFWMTAGYDYVPMIVGMRTVIRLQSGIVQSGSVQSGDFSRAMKVIKSNYSVIDGEERERGWAEEGTGLIAGRAEFDSVRWPDPDAFDYAIFEEAGRLLPPGAKVIAAIGNIFAAVNRLMGFENFCEKSITDPDLVARVFDRIGQIQLRVFENVSRLGVVGATWHPDDIAYASGLMVSPKLLRKHLWPWYKEMCRISRELDKPIVLHSDGKLYQVLDDIVDCGFTGLHPIEPKAMDIVRLKKEYGDKLSLVGNIDLAYTLTLGTPEDVDAEVKERIREVAPGGGYCVGSSNSVTEYVPMANFNAMREAALKYGAYPISIPQ